jgi:hypothetical protein
MMCATQEHELHTFHGCATRDFRRVLISSTMVWTKLAFQVGHGMLEACSAYRGIRSVNEPKDARKMHLNTIMKYDGGSLNYPSKQNTKIITKAIPLDRPSNLPAPEGFVIVVVGAELVFVGVGFEPEAA